MNSLAKRLRSEAASFKFLVNAPGGPDRKATEDPLA